MLDARDLARVQLAYQEFSRHLVRCAGPGGRIHEEAGILLCTSSVDFPVFFNAAWRVDARTPAIDVVAGGDAWFDRLERGWSLSVRDLASDDDLRAAATDAGMRLVTESPEMVLAERPTDVPVPDGVALRWVDDQAGLEAFVAVSEAAYVARGLPAGAVTAGITSLEAFVVPHVHTVVAHLEDEPVAAAQVIVSHGIAHVCWVGAVPAARGRGLGDLVTRVVSQRAFDLGAAFVSLQASDMGEPVYRRMGYREVHRYLTFARLST
jgi:ribosomal protein S18 acetylase RimI-like enzyme